MAVSKMPDPCAINVTTFPATLFPGDATSLPRRNKRLSVAGLVIVEFLNGTNDGFFVSINKSSVESDNSSADSIVHCLITGSSLRKKALYKAFSSANPVSGFATILTDKDAATGWFNLFAVETERTALLLAG